jgi:predicted amidophosphoribosyltransferase
MEIDAGNPVQCPINNPSENCSLHVCKDCKINVVTKKDGICPECWSKGPGVKNLKMCSVCSDLYEPHVRDDGGLCEGCYNRGAQPRKRGLWDLD